MHTKLNQVLAGMGLALGLVSYPALADSCSAYVSEYQCQGDFNCVWAQSLFQCCERGSGSRDFCSGYYTEEGCFSGFNCLWDPQADRCYSQAINSTCQ